MQISTQALITAAYGLWLAGAGVWRFVQAGSKPALGFGLVTALMALIAAGLLYKSKRAAGRILLAITLIFVVGFFITKSAKEGVDVRVGITLMASLVQVIVLLMSAKATAEDRRA